MIGGNLAFWSLGFVYQRHHFTTSGDSNVNVTSTTSFFVQGWGPWPPWHPSGSTNGPFWQPTSQIIRPFWLMWQMLKWDYTITNYPSNAEENLGNLAFLRRPESSDPSFTVNNYILNHKKPKAKPIAKALNIRSIPQNHNFLISLKKSKVLISWTSCCCKVL